MNERRPAGLGIVSVVVIVLVVLKLVGVQPVADWSWWWLLAPFAPAAGGLLIWAVWSMVAMLRTDIGGWWRTKRDLKDR